MLHTYRTFMAWLLRVVFRQDIRYWRDPCGCTHISTAGHERHWPCPALRAWLNDAEERRRSPTFSCPGSKPPQVQAFPAGTSLQDALTAFSLANRILYPHEARLLLVETLYAHGFGASPETLDEATSWLAGRSPLEAELLITRALTTKGFDLARLKADIGVH